MGMKEWTSQVLKAGAGCLFRAMKSQEAIMVGFTEGGKERTLEMYLPIVLFEFILSHLCTSQGVLLSTPLAFTFPLPCSVLAGFSVCGPSVVHPRNLAVHWRWAFTLPLPSLPLFLLSFFSLFSLILSLLCLHSFFCGSLRCLMPPPFFWQLSEHSLFQFPFLPVFSLSLNLSRPQRSPVSSSL